MEVGDTVSIKKEFKNRYVAHPFYRQPFIIVEVFMIDCYESNFPEIRYVIRTLAGKRGHLMVQNFEICYSKNILVEKLAELK